MTSEIRNRACGPLGAAANVAAWGLAMSLLGCEPPAPEPPAAQTASSAATTWAAARRASDVPFFEAPAHVLPSPDAVAVLSPPLDARVVRVVARVGEPLARGAVVVEVMMPELVAAAGALESATELVHGYEARRALLLELKQEGLAQTADVADVEAKLAESRAARQIALSTLRLAGYTAKDARRLLAAPVVALRAPIAGVLVTLDAVPGELRGPSGAPLAKVAGEGEGRVEARLSFELPADAALEFVDAAGGVFALALVSQSPLRDALDGSRTLWAQFAAPSPRRAPSPGAAGRLRARLSADAPHVVVLARAVAQNEHGAYVFVRRNGAVERVLVRVEATSGLDALVAGALAAGDEVASDASLVVAQSEAL